MYFTLFACNHIVSFDAIYMLTSNKNNISNTKIYFLVLPFKRIMQCSAVKYIDFEALSMSSKTFFSFYFHVLCVTNEC